MTENRAKLAASGIRPRYFWTPIWVHVFVMFFGGVIIGPFYLIYFGVRNLLRKQTKFYRIKRTPLFVPDKRYKSGQRPEGVKVEKTKSDITLPATVGERKIYLIKGLASLCFAFLLTLGLYYFYGVYYEKETQAVVKAENGLHLRSDPFMEAEVLTVLPDESRLLVTDSVEGWYQLSVDTINGWANKEYLHILEK